MAKYKVKALALGGLNNKVFKSGDVVTDAAFPAGNVPDLIKKGFLVKWTAKDQKEFDAAEKKAAEEKSAKEEAIKKAVEEQAKKEEEAKKESEEKRAKESENKLIQSILKADSVESVNSLLSVLENPSDSVKEAADSRLEELKDSEGNK